MNTLELENRVLLLLPLTLASDTSQDQKESKDHEGKRLEDAEKNEIPLVSERPRDIHHVAPSRDKSNAPENISEGISHLVPCRGF